MKSTGQQRDRVYLAKGLVQAIEADIDSRTLMLISLLYS